MVGHLCRAPLRGLFDIDFLLCLCYYVSMKKGPETTPPEQEALFDIDGSDLRQITEIKGLLLAIEDIYATARGQGISNAKRKELMAQATQIARQADAIILETFQLNNDAIEDQLEVPRIRGRLRREAVAERESSTQQAVGREAVGSALSEDSYSDGRMRAAEGSVRSPWYDK